MKIKYDQHNPDSVAFEIPDAVIAALVTFGVEMSKAQQKADPKFADCWTHFSFAIDDMFQPAFCFGGSPSDAQVGGELHSDVYEVATGLPWVSRPAKKGSRP
jgi:hypothetical protein